MKKLLIAAMAALFIISTNAAAFGDFEHNDNSVNATGGDSNAKAKASLRARLSSNARATAYQKSISLQGQSNKAVGSGNATTITSNYERSAPGIALGQGDPGYDCSMTGGVSGTLPGGGAAIQWSDASINCELAMVYKLGRKDAATQDRAYEAFDVLFDRVMEQAGADSDNDRDPDVRGGR